MIRFNSIPSFFFSKKKIQFFIYYCEWSNFCINWIIYGYYVNYNINLDHNSIVLIYIIFFQEYIYIIIKWMKSKEQLLFILNL